MAFNPLALLNPIANVFKKVIETKDKRNQRVHAEAMEDGRRITNMDDNDAAYAIQKMKENTGTWKDEVALLTLLIPAWISFIVIGTFDGPAIVTAGFEALAKAPLWYQSLLTTGIGGALGLNEYAKHQKRSRLSVVEQPKEIKNG